MNDAKVVCRQLGYDPNQRVKFIPVHILVQELVIYSISYLIHVESFLLTGPLYLYIVKCVGNEKIDRPRVALETDCQEIDRPIVTTEHEPNCRSSRVSRPPRRLTYCYPEVPI